MITKTLFYKAEIGGRNGGAAENKYQTCFWTNEQNNSAAREQEEEVTEDRTLLAPWQCQKHPANSLPTHACTSWQGSLALRTTASIIEPQECNDCTLTLLTAPHQEKECPNPTVVSTGKTKIRQGSLCSVPCYILLLLLLLCCCCYCCEIIPPPFQSVCGWNKTNHQGGEREGKNVGERRMCKKAF